MPTFSRRATPELCMDISLEKSRAQGKPGAQPAPIASRAKYKKHTSKSPQVRRNQPAFPAQWLTAYVALSPVSMTF